MAVPRRRWVRWGLALAIVTAAAVWFTRPLWRGVPVTPVAPVVGEVVQTVVASGRVLAPDELPVAALRLGTVATVAVEAGDRVAAGQLLATLAPAEAEAGVSRARAAVDGAAARRRALEARLAPVAREALRAARARFAQARRDEARARDLSARGALTPADREQVDTALALAETELRRAESESRALAPDGADAAALDAAEAEARAALALAELHLADTRLVAPVAGIVRARHVAPGAIAQPGAPLFTLVADGPIRLVITPDEKNLRTLAVGQPALASADAFPDARFAARVAWVAPAVDPRRGTVEVRLDVPAPPAELRPDMTVSVEIEVARKPEALTLGRELVRDLASDAPWVLVADAGRAVRRPVTLGLRGDRALEITAGLAPGDLVVPPGPGTPAEGAKLLVRPPAPASPTPPRG